MQVKRTKTFRIQTVVGARPQFIKAAVFSRAVLRMGNETGIRFEEEIIHTGQHFDYEMSQAFFDILKIPPPDFNLNIHSCSHGEMTGRMLIELEKIFINRQPDLVLVYGDTNSTLAGSLAAAKLHIPVAHIEAGLRSRNRSMPEEINRVATDHLSDILLCPTKTAMDNLEAEGLSAKAFLVGDIMYDSLLYYTRIAENESDILNRLGLESGKYYLGTLHRQENTDNLDRLESIWQAFRQLAEEGEKVVIPLHPGTRRKLKDNNVETGRVTFLEPVSYLDMLILEKSAKAILTDSGGIQKEAYWLGVPCITLRDETEWKETVDSGWNVLAGADTQRILNATKSIYKGTAEGRFYGSGDAAERIIKILIEWFLTKTKKVIRSA